MFRTVATAVVTAILTSAFWIFAFNTGALPTAEGRKVKPSGDVAVVDPKGGPPVAIAEGVEVGPAGLAIPVAGIKAEQLTDTFTQARAGGARVHDAIDIMARRRHAGHRCRATERSRSYSSRDGGGGITLYVRSPDHRWTYYYAHLQGYAPGLAEGQQVKRGQRDRPRRPYRQCQRRRAASPFRDQPHGARPALVGGRSRSIPTRCLPGKRPTAKAAANPRLRPRRLFHQS